LIRNQCANNGGRCFSVMLAITDQCSSLAPMKTFQVFSLFVNRRALHCFDLFLLPLLLLFLTGVEYRLVDLSDFAPAAGGRLRSLINAIISVVSRFEGRWVRKKRPVSRINGCEDHGLLGWAFAVNKGYRWVRIAGLACPD